MLKIREKMTSDVVQNVYSKHIHARKRPQDALQARCKENY